MNQASTLTTSYSAAQIAQALRVTPRRVRTLLSGVSPTGTRLVNGNITNVWSDAALPEVIRTRLQTETSAQPSPLAIPLAQCSDACIDQARRLQRAQAAALAVRNQPGVDLGSLLVRDYRAAFGHEVTTRHALALYRRTLNRAGHDENFDRLELFLPERLKLRAPACTAPQSIPDEFSGLAQLIQAFRDPASPTADERQLLWDECAVCLAEDVSAGDSHTARKARLLNFLGSHASFLASSRASLRVTFNRRLARWQELGGTFEAMADGRTTRTAAPMPLDENERAYFLWLAAKFENVSLAWRKFLASDKATAETKAAFSHTWQPPKWARDLVTRDARNLAPHIRGPRNAKLAGAYIERDPNALASGDSDQSDDLTLPLYWWDELPDGTLFIGQGQLLVWIDERSWLFYGLDLISDGAYSGFSIRNSWTCKADEHGLPRKKIHVEMGIWRKASVFTGRRWKQGNQSLAEVGTGETEQGLRRLGIRFHHSTLPRGKVIERAFGSMQDLMHTWPGYAGRCQPVDKFELVQNQVKLCKSGKEHPEKFFFHKSQMVERLLELGAEFNRTPKFGKYHEGRTPLQTYEKCFTTPLVKLGADLRHLVAMNKIEDVQVGRNGVAFRYGRQSFTYKNHPALSALKGSHVHVWFDPSKPEFCTITNLEGAEPIVVPRESLVPGDGATDDQMHAAMASNATMNAHYKDLHRALRTRFSHEFAEHRFRPVLIDRATAETGRSIRRQTEAQQAAQKETARKVTRASKAARELGIDMRAVRRPEQLESIPEFQRLLESFDVEEDTTTQDMES